jgi:hypothetical protein
LTNFLFLPSAIGAGGGVPAFPLGRGAGYRFFFRNFEFFAAGLKRPCIDPFVI